MVNGPDAGFNKDWQTYSQMTGARTTSPYFSLGNDLRFRHINNTQMNDYQPQRGQGPRGGFEFAAGVTGLNATGAPATNQFNGYAAFLLGLPSVYGKSFQVLDPMTVREWQ